MFRIDLCHFFDTPARGGICLHLLDQEILQEIFFVPSPEPVYLGQSMTMLTKQQIHTPMGLTIDLYSVLILFLSNCVKQRFTRPDFCPTV